MKIGILTLSASDNCGSLLQTYALQEVLKKLGHEVEVIDFITVTSQKMYRIFHPSYIREPKKFLGMFLGYRALVHQKEDYQKFRDEILNLTNEQYTSSEKLKKLDGVYDIVVCGSDQVWNVYMHDFDQAFLLSWCNQSKRVSYAASLGDQKKGKCSDMIEKGFEPNQFKAISVREVSTANKFKRELDLDVQVCLDPTLLLSLSEWKKVMNPYEVPKEKYIFYYSYNYADDIKNRIVKEFSQENNLQVYVINASRWVDGKEKKFGFKIFEQAGPLAFLNLMRGCEYSLVESFHGTVFSYIFQRQFWFLKNSNDGLLDDRINDLMNILETKHRVLYLGKKNWNDDAKVIYENEPEKLKKMREQSLRFLEDHTIERDTK